MADIGYSNRVARIAQSQQDWFAARTQRKQDADNRKNKKKSGQLVINDPGSIRVKLAKAYGGKAADKIIKRNRLRLRMEPDAINVIDVTDPSAPVALTRGLDFVVVTGYGEPTLLLHDRVKEFKAEMHWSVPGFEHA